MYSQKLDNKIGRLIKNTKIDKDRKRKEVKNIEVLKKEFVDFGSKLENIKFKTIYIGNKSIELNNQTSEELKNDNILVI